MASNRDFSKFANLTFEDFRTLAKDPTLSRHQKVGFPDSYRSGKEQDVFLDVCAKVSQLNASERLVLEIGPGCSNLPIMLSQLCKSKKNNLIFVDSDEMLSHLPDDSHISKYPGIFPDAIYNDINILRGNVHAIISYSVIQYVFSHGSLFGFLDVCLSLLADGGEILFGDIPNISMRKRFFSSKEGYNFHKEFTGLDENPNIEFNQLEIGNMDDSVVMAILSRARAQGFHAWVMPQPVTLPMANRREDILIRKP